jgi:hypothetical protein
MFLKVFHVTVVLFLAIISIALLAFVFTGLFSLLDSPMLSGGSGISAVAGGLSAKLFGFLVIAGSLLVAGVYLFLRRRKLR